MVIKVHHHIAQQNPKNIVSKLSFSFLRRSHFFTDLCCLCFMNKVEKPVTPLPLLALCY